MRTLQEKYNAIQEGKFSKEHFLAEARMQQPQLVTRFNGYDDAVQILKNKGMIVEVSAEESFKDYSNDALADMIINSSRFEGNEEGIARVKAELERRKQAVNEAKGHSFTFNYNTDPDDVQYIQRVLDDAGADAIAKAGTFDDEMIVRAFDAMGLRRAKKALESDGFDISENVSEAKQTKLTKKSLTDYRYKPTNDMDKYPYEQILRGLRVELEVLGVSGTPTAEEYSKALAKVSKNLAKDSIFYTNQVAGVNTKVDLHDKMVTATAKNTVDTFNGMKKAELKEGFKKLIKKVLSENMGDMFGDEETAERSANYGQPGEDEYDFYSNPENYKDEDDMFEMYGEDTLDESAIGDIHILAQESGSLKDFLQSVKAQHPGVDLRRDIEELQHIWNNREQDQVDYDDIDISDSEIDYDDENFSDPFIDGEDDLFEGKKSLSELLK